MDRKGWSQMEVPSGWLQVIRGPRLRSQQWPSAKRNPVHWRQFKGATGNPQGSKTRLSPDAAREIAQSSATRLGKALEAMGDVQGPAVEVLKAELTKARAAQKQPAVEVEVGHTACRGVCSQDGGPGTSREVVGSAVPSPHQDAVTGSRATGDVTSADGEHRASRTRCVGARVPSGEAAVARQVN